MPRTITDTILPISTTRCYDKKTIWNKIVMGSKKSKKAKKLLRLRILKAFLAVCVFGIAVAGVFLFSVFIRNNRDITLSDLKTHYSSLSLKVSYNTDCADEVRWKVDYRTGDSFGEIENGTEDKYNCKRYFLGSREQMYRKVFGSEWEIYDFRGEFPDSRITKVLEYISRSDGELLTKEDNGIFVFGVKTLNRPQEIYEYLNDISALGNDWGSENYSSLSAKVYVHQNGDISKIIFYPKSKRTDASWYRYATNTRLMLLTTKIMSYEKEKNTADYDYIRSCSEITWTFSNLDGTEVNYKEDLWNVLK